MTSSWCGWSQVGAADLISAPALRGGRTSDLTLDPSRSVLASAQRGL